MERTWVELPEYRALLVVDVKDFSGLRGRHHAEVTDAIPDVLGGAFERCGAPEVWDGRRFAQSTGDGLSAGFGSGVLPLLLNPFLRSLQDELDHLAGIRALPAALRMRVSVAVGPVTDPNPDGVSTGSGPARVENHRLLDSAPVRDLLARSGPATRVAAVVSARAYEDAVLPGYAGEPPELYVPVPVREKGLRGEAYLRVPSPTGGLLRNGFLADAPADAAEPAAAPGGPGLVVHNVHGANNVNSGSGIQFNGPGARHHDRRRL